MSGSPTSGFFLLQLARSTRLAVARGTALPHRTVLRPAPLCREKDEVIKSLRSRLSIAQQQAQQQVAVIVEPPPPAGRASGDAAVGTLEAQNAQLEVSHHM